jgi:hypothetical protein
MPRLQAAPIELGFIGLRSHFTIVSLGFHASSSAPGSSLQMARPLRLSTRRVTNRTALDRSSRSRGLLSTSTSNVALVG